MAAQGRENFEKLGFYSQTRLQSRLYLYHDDCGRYQKPQIYDYRGMYIKLVHIATDLRNNDHAVEMHGPGGDVSSKYEYNRDAPLTPVLKNSLRDGNGTHVIPSRHFVVHYSVNKSALTQTMCFYSHLII